VICRKGKKEIMRTKAMKRRGIVSSGSALVPIERGEGGGVYSQ
jgi:hypothetical protein